MTEGNRKSVASKLIDENLQRVFQDLSDEELPKRLKNLLDELRAQDGRGDDAAKGESGAPSQSRKAKDGP